MSILETHATNYAWSNRLLDTTYSGACVTVRRDDGDPLTDPTQDINYVDGEIDMSSLTTFLGASAGYVTVAYVPQGTDDWVQTDPAKQPRIDVRNDQNGLAQIAFPKNVDSTLAIADAHSFGEYTLYFLGQYLGSEAPTGSTSETHLIGPEGQTISRAEAGVTTLKSGGTGDNDQFGVQVHGTTTSTSVLYTNDFGSDETDDKLVVAKVDNTNGLASLYYNQSVIGEDLTIDSAGGSGVQMIRSVGFLSYVYVSAFLYYPDAQHNDTTREAIENYLLQVPQLVVTVKNKETDAAIEGAVVKFFEMDAFTADGMDNTSVFQNVTALDGVYLTNASGVATYTGATAFNDTKVQFAMALDSTYDASEWKFAGWCHVATENITKTAPA